MVICFFGYCSAANYSCHSCHTDGHSNGRLNDNSSDESYGDPKRVISLLGTAGTSPWAWNGKTGSIEEQVRRSIESTMQGPEPSDLEVRAIADYVRTLPPPTVARRGSRRHERRES